MLGINTIKQWRNRNVENEVDIAPAVAPVYPYITSRGLRYCTLAHQSEYRIRNGDIVVKYLVKDTETGLHCWISDKQLIINSWFTMRDGVQ